MSKGIRIAIVLSTALAARVAILGVDPSGLDVDTDAYRQMALVLRATGTFGVLGDNGTADPAAAPEVRPTAFRPPLYPVLLSALVTGGRLSPIAVGTLNLTLGVATVLVTYGLGRWWGLGNWSLLAAVLTACDPLLLHQSTQIMTETLAAFLAASCLAALTCWLPRGPEPAGSEASRHASLAESRGGIMVGLIVGLACLCRPTFQPWGGLLVLSLLATRAAWPVRLVRGAALLAGIASILVPWGLRNYWQLGKLEFATSHGGYTLLLGNNPSFYRYVRGGDWGGVWRSEELASAWGRRDELVDATEDLFALIDREPAPQGSRVVRDEIEDDALAYAFARRYIRAEPASFAAACLVRLGRFWQLLPRPVDDRESTGRYLVRRAVAAWYALVFALVVLAAGLAPRRLFARPWQWGVLLCLAFTSVHALYWSDMRMRAPLMPFLALVASLGAQQLTSLSLRRHT